MWGFGKSKGMDMLKEERFNTELVRMIAQAMPVKKPESRRSSDG